MRLLCYLLFLIFTPTYCLAENIINIEKCELHENHSIKLISLRTIDGDTPYLVFDNIITNAFLDGSTYSGEILLSKCVNHALIFALNYGSPYVKGCLITNATTRDNIEGFCFAEKNTPASIWFEQQNTLLVFNNDNNLGDWQGKYIIYDSRKNNADAYDELPKKSGYKIYHLNPTK